MFRKCLLHGSTKRLKQRCKKLKTLTSSKISSNWILAESACIFWKKKYFFQKLLISLQIKKQNKKAKEIWCANFLLFSIFYVITASLTIRPINLTYLPFLFCFNFKVYHLLFIHYQFNSLSRLFIFLCEKLVKSLNRYLVLRNLLGKLMGKMFSLLFLNLI